MTDVFKCKKAGTQCCAPKSKVLEAMGISRNDTFPLATTHPHTQAHTPHTYTPQTLPYTTAMSEDITNNLVDLLIIPSTLLM